MPAVYRDVVSEREKLLLDAADELIEIAAWQIGAADAALEEHIAGDDEALRLTVAWPGTKST